jgi:hypothetical protein
VIEGVLAVVADEGVVLNNAVIKDSSDMPLAGDVFVPRQNIRFVQIARARKP